MKVRALKCSYTGNTFLEEHRHHRTAPTALSKITTLHFHTKTKVTATDQQQNTLRAVPARHAAPFPDNAVAIFHLSVVFTLHAPPPALKTSAGSKKPVCQGMLATKPHPGHPTFLLIPAVFTSRLGPSGSREPKTFKKHSQQPPASLCSRGRFGAGIMYFFCVSGSLVLPIARGLAGKAARRDIPPEIYFHRPSKKKISNKINKWHKNRPQLEKPGFQFTWINNKTKGLTWAGGEAKLKSNL